MQHRKGTEPFLRTYLLLGYYEGKWITDMERRFANNSGSGGMMLDTVREVLEGEIECYYRGDGK